MKTSVLPAPRRHSGVWPLRALAHPELKLVRGGLSADRERDLAARIKTGDQDARNELVEGNLALPVKYALKFAQKNKLRSLTLDDLLQEGRMALVYAAERFDPDAFGTRFSTYAMFWIKQRICRAVETG